MIGYAHSFYVAVFDTQVMRTVVEIHYSAATRVGRLNSQMSECYAIRSIYIHCIVGVIMCGVIGERYQAAVLVFTFKDNGEGFSLSEKFNGNGLKNMKTRASKLGGVLEISSKKGEGTEVQLELDITQMGN